MQRKDYKQYFGEFTEKTASTLLLLLPRCWLLQQLPLVFTAVHKYFTAVTNTHASQKANCGCRKFEAMYSVRCCMQLVQRAVQ
jgi:hypothetical protein